MKQSDTMRTYQEKWGQSPIESLEEVLEMFDEIIRARGLNLLRALYPESKAPGMDNLK